MAERTGTAQTFDIDAAASGSESLTVPGDCTAIIFFWSMYDDNDDLTMSSLSVDGDSATLELNVEDQSNGSDGNGGGIGFIANPSTGSQTLSWAWSGRTGAMFAGGAVHVVYVKGVDTADLVRDTDFSAEDNAPSSATVTSIATDLVLGYATGAGTNDPDLAGTVFIDGYLQEAASEDQTEDLTEATAGASTTTITNNTTGNSFPSTWAVSLKTESGATVAVSQVNETDLAQGMTPSPGNINVAIAQASETDLAQDVDPVAGAQSITVDQVNETDLAQAFTADPGNLDIAVDQVAEADLAQAMTPGLGAIVVSLDQVNETDLAQNIAASQGGLTISVEQVSEADLAQAMTPGLGAIVVSLDQVNETDLAQIMGLVSGGQFLTLGQVTETDNALVITPSPGNINVAIGQVTETDLAQAIAISESLALELGLVSESDTALSISPAFGAISVLFGQASEADQALGVSPIAVIIEGQVFQVPPYIATIEVQAKTTSAEIAAAIDTIEVNE